MRQLIFLTLSIVGLLPSFAQTKKVCVSIDDLPTVSYGVNDSTSLKNLTEKLIGSLKKNKIPAIGFVNEIKLYENDVIIPFQVRLLTRWVESNLELGNHTFSHPDYNNHSMKFFSNDILKGEVVTKKVLSGKRLTLKYFRHPFLHTGNPKQKNDSLDYFLTRHGYTIAPVTIDNEDYLFALAYKRANDKGDHTLMKQIGSDYVAYMENKVLYFEIQARALFGRNINQILLIHASLLNADYMDELAKMLRKNDYDFISMQESLRDEAYNTPVTVFGNWGISWIDRWALSQGKKGDFFKGDPAIPDYIKKLSQ